MELSRRDILKLGVFGSAALMLPLERVARTELARSNRLATSQLPQPFTVPFVTPPVLQPVYQDPGTAYYDLVQQQTKVEILPGRQTTIWGYNGITPGPTIVNYRGQSAVVRQTCALPDVHPDLRYNVWTSTHLHGSCSLPEYDGYASDVTFPGHFKDYRYPNIQDARTLWYHDHGVHITAENAYMGLAAQYILHDDVEMALPIPHGQYDIPFVLKDAMFQDNGDLIIDNNSESGIYGDVVLVNGRPWPLMHVEPRKYRFRILNASVSRSYDLSLDTGEPLTVIATDGGLMPHPQPVGHFRIGTAERYEVVIDFAKYSPGQRVVLRNASPKNNIDFEGIENVMAFEVGATVTDWSNNEIPNDLNPNMSVMGLTEADAVAERYFRFERGGGQWTINKHTWEDVVNTDYAFTLANPAFESVEIWELENKSGGWFHPVHIHLVDFRILSRNGSPPLPHELGPKDVVYVGEGEKVRLIMRFEHQRGKYMIHCHNLVHEDHDMMGQFEVGDGGDAEHHPVRADPCKGLPAGPLFTRPRPREDDDDNSGKGSDNSGSGNSGSSSSALAPRAPSSGRFTSKPKPKKKRKACATAKRKKPKAKPKKSRKVARPKATKAAAKKPPAKKAPKKKTKKKTAASCKPARKRKPTRKVSRKRPTERKRAAKRS
jgi:spore coat protein A, manganese oxidase